MAGYLCEDGIFVDDPYESVTADQARSYYRYIPDPSWLGADQVFGANTWHDITAQVPEALTGSIAYEFSDIWYNTIHVLPGKLELGNLLSNQIRNIVLWNAYFDDRDLTAYNLVDPLGLNVIQPVTPTYTLRPLEFVTYEVQVSTDGPPSINSVLELTVDGHLILVPITGTRVVVWPFQPNWESPVNETIEWLTSVQRAKDGSEQRFSLRSQPRRSFEFSSLVYRSSFMKMQSILFGWQGRVFGIPTWTEVAHLVADTLSGALTIEVVDAQYRGFTVDKSLIFFDSYSRLETLEVLSIAGNLITLKTPTTMDWTTDTKVMPMLICQLETSLSTNYETDSVAQVTTRWKAMADQPTNLQLVAAPSSYQSIEYFARPPNWEGGIDVEVVQDMTTTDNSIGPFLLNQQSVIPQVTYSHSWIGVDRNDQELLKNFLARRKGRAVPAYMPVFTDDIKLATVALPASANIDCEDNGMATLLANNLWRRDIRIQMVGGTVVSRRITAYTTLGGGLMRLTLDSPVGVEINPSDVVKISMIGLFRLASDAITLTHITDSICDVKIPLIWTKQ